MSNFHEQAMHFVYQQVLHRLLGFFSRPERIALQLLVQRILVAAGGLERIGSYRVMVVHEGGKECAYTLAFLRAAQLSIAGRTPETFTLRIAILRQPRVTTNVMARIQTQCNELYVYDDPTVELLLVDEKQVRRLDKHIPVAFERLASVMDRTQILMAGHLSEAAPRATFFYADLLSRAKLYRRACEWGGHVDALIDRRPPEHLGEYTQWIRQVALKQGHAANALYAQGFESAVKLCSKLDDDFKHWLRLPVPLNLLGTTSADTEINVINVFDCLSYEVDMLHSQVLMFVEGSWNVKVLDIEEPQAAVVLLSAHIQGIRGVCHCGDEYHVGVQDFLRKASADNQTNERYKGQVIKKLGGSFNTPKRIERLRQTITHYLAELHGMTDEHLICALYSPFVDQASGLEVFLQQRHPEKLHVRNDLRQTLMEENAASEADVKWLESVSGLPVSSLRVLFGMSKTDFSAGKSLIAALWMHDPDKQL